MRSHSHIEKYLSELVPTLIQIMYVAAKPTNSWLKLYKNEHLKICSSYIEAKYSLRKRVIIRITSNAYKKENEIYTQARYTNIWKESLQVHVN